MAVMASSLFTFDYFLKSRSASELNRRVDVLVRIVEKVGLQSPPRPK
jgi:hypothetical protein